MNNSSIEITNDFIKQWTPLVWRLAKQYRAIGDALRLDYEDLVQIGMVGLIEAAQTYDGRNGSTFLTYAFGSVRYAILNALNAERVPPQNLFYWLREYNRTADKLLARLGRVPDIEEIAAELGQPLAEVQNALTALSTIYADAYHLEDIPGYEDILRSRSGWDPLVYAIREENDRQINEWLAEQPARVREVILLRYQAGMETRQIAETLGISKCRANQILHGVEGRYVGAIQEMRTQLNPTKEELAEKRASEQERAARVTSAMERHKLRRRQQNAAYSNRRSGFHRPSTGQKIEFLEDSANLMVRAGVPYKITVLSSGKFRITDERGWHTTESMARLRTAKFKQVAA